MFREPIFAARIYSISGFTETPVEEFVNKFRRLFSHYFNVDVLLDVLRGCGEYAQLSLLLARAKELAGSETDTGSGRTADGKNLASVFSRLSLFDGQKDRTEFYRYAYRTLTPAAAFPEKRIGADGKKELIHGFYRELRDLEMTPPGDYDAFSICFDRISQKYMWCVAASDFEGEDISLYDHMKVTEAIMSCLLDAEDADNCFTLVAGDFSGIQKYIFSIASANYSGVAKRLRARSFYVDIVSRVFSQYVVDAFGVGRANILLQTGGKFYCLIPTRRDTEQKLRTIRNEFDDHLYQTFHGNVSMNVAWLCCGDRGLEQYSDTIVRLNDRLGEKKAVPFEEILKKDNGWDPEAFVLTRDLAGKHVCKYCGEELIDGSEECCGMCRMEMEIGGKLPRTRYIVYTKAAGKNRHRIFKDYYISLVGNDREESFEGAYLIEGLNEASADGTYGFFPVVRKYMANHVPVEDKDTKSFSEIAAAGKGMNKLAVLKADVDVLGFLFAQGLRTRERHFGTVSRVNTMSRMLEVFFSGYMEELLENTKYKNVYSVFSGGDDLFLIGPWDVMMGLAVEIQKAFRRFVADNDSVTMSAAVVLFDDKEHIAFMADESEEQLSRAKNELLPEVYPDRMGRNAVCAMGELFSWTDFEEQLENADRIKRLLENRLIDVGVFRRITKYSTMYRQYLIDKDIWKLMFEPLFYYDRKRNHKYNTRDDDCRWFKEEYIKSMENAADFKKVRKNLYFAETAVKIALNKTRRVRS